MRRLLATTVLFAALVGTVALVAQAPTTAAETLRGKDESCWDPQPGKGKSRKMWCDPPYCGPCFEVACEPGICHFVCVPIPGCSFEQRAPSGSRQVRQVDAVDQE